MAGDWLKVEKDTPDKPEVLAIAAKLSITPDEAFGKCFRIWRWFDSHTTQGNACSVTTALLDALVNRSGFGDALVSVGWLSAGDNGLQVPNFDRHMGQSAKQRGLTAKRVAEHKRKSNAKGNDPSVSDALPREEKRREEKKENTNTDEPGGYSQGFVMFWGAYPKHRRSNMNVASKAWHDSIVLIGTTNDMTGTKAEDWLLERVRAFAKSWLGQSKFCPGCDKWLTNAKFFDADEAWAENAQPEQQPLQLLTDDEKKEWRPS